MQASKQRGGRVVYVAGSARELPEAVQTWLSQTCTRAIASSHIYDALAILTTHRRPAALIVSIETVDWDELEFFELARQIARETRVYVVGSPHQQAKIDAAIERGAHPFDPDRIAEDLARAGRGTARWTTTDVLADMTHASGNGRPTEAPVSEAPPRAQGPVETHGPAPLNTQPGTVEPIEKPETVDESEPTSGPSFVRLMREESADEASETVGQEPETPVPFPWSPSPNRPKRTPPQARPQRSDEGKPEAARSPEQAGEPEQERPDADRAPVQLTSEELAALMGRPRPDKPPSAQEQQP